LLGISDYTPGRALVQVGAGSGGLTQKVSEFSRLGFEFQALLLEGSRLICSLNHLVSQLNGPGQDLLDYITHSGVSSDRPKRVEFGEIGDSQWWVELGFGELGERKQQGLVAGKVFDKMPQ